LGRGFGLAVAGRERLKIFAADPQVVEDDGEFTGDGDDGAFAGAGSAAVGHFQAPLAQGRIGSEAAEDIVGALHEQAPHERIAGFGDAELGVFLAGLAAFGIESEEGADVTAFGETVGTRCRG
jgi:hypothetical protein